MKKSKAKRKPGPEAERLTISGDWKSAVRGAIKRGPYTGPTPNKPAKKRGKKRR